MDILRGFGFETKLFIAQIINFLILAYLLKRFLYKPLLEVMRKREEKIKSGIEYADQSKLILEKTEQDKNDIIKNARIEAEKIITETKSAAEGMKREILDNSRQEAVKIMTEAKTQASLEMKKMEKNVETMSLDLSQKILNNLITSLFDEQEKKKIMEKAVGKLKDINK